jgi:RNA polymerase sigma factor (sigma-70 family)
MKTLLFNERLPHPPYQRLSLAEERALYESIHADLHQIQALVELFLSRIYHHCYFHLGDDLAAEKATSTIFAELPEAFRTYRWRDDLPLSKWIYERMRKYLTQRIPGQPSPTAEHAQSASFDALTADEQALVLKDTLGRVPFDQREALILTYYDGLKPEAIGRLLGSSAHDAEVLIAQAVQLLAARLETSAHEVRRHHPAFKP